MRGWFCEMARDCASEGLRTTPCASIPKSPHATPACAARETFSAVQCGETNNLFYAGCGLPMVVLGGSGDGGTGVAGAAEPMAGWNRL